MVHPAEKEIRALFAEIERKQEIETQAKSLNSDLKSLNSDQEFLKPKWEDFSLLSVVTLWTAVCLATGVNPKHKFASLSWLQHATDHLEGDAGNRVRELQKTYTFALSEVDAGDLTQKLSLKRFLTWAQKNELPLPTQFPRVKPRTGRKSVAAASDAPTPETTVPTWGLITSLTRAHGYRWPLYQFLKAAHIAGKPCPKAREVLEGWKLDAPPELEVMTDGVKYNNAMGNAKEANLKAIQQAIKGLLKKQAG